MAKAKRGRASIFRGKDGGIRVQGIITKIGGTKFEAARSQLSQLYFDVHGAWPKTVSDADVIEYMARGFAGTRSYLESERSRR